MDQLELYSLNLGPGRTSPKKGSIGRDIGEGRRGRQGEVLKSGAGVKWGWAMASLGCLEASMDPSEF